jgi:ubiquitin C-terminal hydrolase
MKLLCQPQFANFQNINSVTIIDCFDYYQKMEAMSEENSMYCDICKKEEKFFYQSYIVTSPEIIIIILDRGEDIEFNVKLEYYEFLNLQEYV